MQSGDLVDSELAPLLEMFPPLVLSSAELPGLRKQIAASFPTSSPPVAGVEVAKRRIARTPGTDDIELLIYRARGSREPLPAMLHFHGGGHIMGAPAMSHLRNCDLAIEARCVVISVDYRLAPENPFPSALDDAYSTLKWVHANASVLRVDPRRIGVVGESAGAGLAASLTQLARDKGEVKIAFQSLIYPMLDDRTGEADLDVGPGVGEYVWTIENNRFAWEALLGARKPGHSPPRYSVPARMEDLSGLPAAFIAVGALDLFVREDLRYANRLILGGVPTELHLYPGAVHAFDFAVDSAVARRFRADHISATKRALGVGNAPL